MTQDLIRMSALTLCRLIAARKLRPIDVLEAHLAQIARLNPKINAVVTLAEEAARKEAHAAQIKLDAGDAVEPLCGLPVLIKDVTLTAGLRTTFGSPLYKDFVPSEDAEVVTRLRRSGAIIFGKTNTPEFAAGANTVNAVFGATRNPWNLEMSPAGSSGGAAAAVATGMAPLAQGTDYACSIRVPASFCGIIGLRPTAGLIPNRPTPMPWHWGSVHGPLARSAEDAALMLDAMTGLDPLWPLSVAPPWTSALEVVEQTENAKGLKVVYVADMTGFGVDPEVDAICQRAALDLASHGAEVDLISFDASEGIAAYKTLRAADIVTHHWQRLDQLDTLGANLAGNIKDGLGLSTSDIAAAQAARNKILERFRGLFMQADIVITPAAPIPPYPLAQNFPTEINGRKLENYMDWLASEFLITLVGFPAAAVPAGVTASGLPIGLQIIGPRFSEPRLLGLCKLVQATHRIGFPPME
jgi:amidase